MKRPAENLTAFLGYVAALIVIVAKVDDPATAAAITGTIATLPHAVSYFVDYFRDVRGPDPK